MPTQRIPAGELCDARFLAALDRLRLVARRRVAPRGAFAEHRSRDQGSGIEFKDYRPYAPGDDLRGVDWNVYRRLGRVFLRLFEELEDLPLYLLVDCSRSAFHSIEGEAPRAKAALRCALGLASISLGQHDRVGVYACADDLRPIARPAAGKGRILSLAQRLSEIEPLGATDLARSLASFESLRLRDGLLCLISDFFDPAGLDAVLAALRRQRHRLLLVRTYRASDREPVVAGDLRLVDCETRAAADVSITPQLLERYRAAHDRFERALADFARARGCGLLLLDAGRDVLPQLESLFATGTYNA